MPVTRDSELDVVMVELREAVGFLPDRDRDCAGSLLAHYRRTGTLTAKQRPWAINLADRAMRAAPRSFGTHVVAVASWGD